jgi:DNA-binding SARP family transcriptional activator
MLFRILGPLEVRDGEGWATVPAGQQRLLLAVLLIEAGRAVSVGRLTDELWGARPPARAAATVQVYIGRLRRLLGDELSRLLVTRQHGYELAVGDGDLDVSVHDALVASARAARAAGRSDAAVEYFQKARALWRGPALADVPDSPTVASWAASYERGRLDAMEDRLGAELDVGRHAQVAAEAQRLVGEHPLRERLQAHYLVALYRCGRRNDALEAYRNAHRILVDELGLEPGPELRGIEKAILADDRQPADMPARIEAPPVRSVPAQLPPVPAGFTGRASQLAQLDALLDAGTADPVMVISTVAGCAGAGKTALALHWTHRVRDRFVDGQLYVNLQGYAPAPPRRAADALAGFLRALGVPPDQIPSDTEQAAATYRSLLDGKRMLVVLDNANHPDQVRPMLPGSPNCFVLITTRDRMTGLVARDGAVRLDLDVLTPEESRQLLARLIGTARAAAEPAAVARLADLCGHLPLALRIAAANLTTHPHATVASHVERLQRDRLTELEVTEDPLGGVRTAFDHSYRSLPELARHVFRAIGLIPGADFTADAAAALADIPVRRAARVLDVLAGAHLAERYTDSRYRLHDLIRSYAAERAAAELPRTDSCAAVDRLSGYYMRSVDAAADRVYPETLRLPLPATSGPTAHFDGHCDAVAWLDAERPNLVATAAYASSHGHPSVAWRLADALRGYLTMYRHTHEWSDLGRIGLAAAEADGNRQGMAAAHLSLAGLHWAAARNDEAIGHYQVALDLTRDVGWAEGEAATLCNLGLVRWNAGQIGEAADLFNAALAVDEKTGRVASRAANFVNLGQVYAAQGRLDLAARCYGAAQDHYRQVGSRSGQATTLAYLGETYHELSRLDEASDTLHEAIGLLRDLGERRTEGEAIRLLAAVQRDRGRHADALELAGQGLAYAQELNDGRNEAEALVVQASIAHQRGAHEEALAGFGSALDLALRDGYGYTRAEALIGLAAALLDARRPDSAHEAATAALAAVRAGGYRLLEGGALIALASTELSRGQPEQALHRAQQALTIHTETGQLPGLARAHRVALAARRAAGRPAAGGIHHDQEPTRTSTRDKE